jgi:hypothetical protein
VVPIALLFAHDNSGYSRFLFFFFLFLSSAGFWMQGFVPARQVLHHLSYTFSPFNSGYFGDTISLFSQDTFDYNLPILCFLLQLGWQTSATLPTFFPLSSGLQTYLPTVDWNQHSPNLSFPKIAWMTRVYHYIQLLAELGSHKIFFQARYISWCSRSQLPKYLGLQEWPNSSAWLLLLFHVNFWIGFSISVNYDIGVLIGIALNL